jgi:hypothetical protein
MARGHGRGGGRPTPRLDRPTPSPLPDADDVANLLGLRRRRQPAEPEAALAVAVLRQLAERQPLLEPCPLQGADFLFRNHDQLPARSACHAAAVWRRRVAPGRDVAAGAAARVPT